MSGCSCQTVAVNRLCPLHGDRQGMTVLQRFGDISNQGDTVNFFTCRTCFGAVQRQDRDGHNDWHNDNDPRGPRD